MEHFFAYPLQDIPLVLLALAAALSVHEFAHAYVAYKFGDPTAQKQGRLTLSPLAHLDIVGTLAILLLGFGWARPVPVNPYFFKNPRLAGILVSVAGPVSNLILGTIGLAIWYALISFGVVDMVPESVTETLSRFFNIFIVLNIVLFVFNLLPLPPLDGYRIVEDLMPTNIRAKMTQFENYGIIIFLILVVTPLDQYTIQPIFNVVVPNILDTLQSLLAPIFG
ncbi:site-2 protease family protein [Ectobacillus antri]|jgi:Zn-dependent protease|uniref:Site-2 protease family protein n=1 Tax=Ectobacillus antri TaxID=2486280 RepID=A0ABT6H5Q7_9BACI|nr:site-2 protease family protein [Ectobacillus antri]MDG4657674.1 site-2 protease family protein [Ectobacillus antri]MDG5754681.1 site-2 protease family protein [Ectobacillus antri]